MKRLTRDVSRWNIYLHRTARDLPMVEVDDRPELQLADEIFDRLYGGDDDNALLCGPLHAPAAREALELHAMCAEMPEFERLCRMCLGNEDASATGTEVVMKHLADAQAKRAKEAKPGMTPPPPNAQQAMKALQEAVKNAAVAIRESEEAAEIFGDVAFGRQAGEGTATGNPMDAARPRHLARRLQKDPRLKRIALLAGRISQIAANKQRTKALHGSDEIVDIEQGSDLARLLPSEMGALLHPLRRLALMRDLIESRALQYRVEGTEVRGKGPIVVLLDKSGSMGGASDEWATAVALALLMIAQRQRRAFALLGFDHEVKSESIVEVGQGLPEKDLFTSCGGGTSIAKAVARGLEIIRTKRSIFGKADLVLITDGESDITQAPKLRKDAAEMNVTMLGFGIGVSERTLAPWCDETQAINNLSTVDDAAADKLFRI